MNKKKDIKKQIEILQDELLKQEMPKQEFAKEPSGITKPYVKKRKWREKLKIARSKNTILVKMLLECGEWDTFLAYPIANNFEYNGNDYVVDDSLKVYDRNAKMYSYFYHENFSLPFKIDINVNKIRNAISRSDIDNIDIATNPKTLRFYIKSQFIQKIMQGADLEEINKFIKMMLTIILIGIGILIVLSVHMSELL